MGANGWVSFGGCEILGFRNQVSNESCLLFQESDRVYVPGNGLDGDDWEPESFRYETTVLVAKARLGLMGFSSERARQLFSNGLDIEIRGERLAYASFPPDADPESKAEAADYLAALESYNFTNWQKCAVYLLKHKPSDLQHCVHVDLEDIYCRPDLRPKYLRHIRLFENFAWGIPGFQDIRQAYAGLIEVFRDTDPVVLDCSDLVNQNKLDEDFPVVTNGWSQLRLGLAHNEPVVLLTEGSTDAALLSQSLSLLFGEFRDRFQFLDFSAINLKGGASSLVDQLKAFAAAGFRNRILAIVDNDAVGRDALRMIQTLKLPRNFGAMRLPDIELAGDYPTIGPQGRVNADVNGQAVSIEMFAGKRLLFDSENLELSPVVWRGYVEGVKAYQGELRDKTKVL